MNVTVNKKSSIVKEIAVVVKMVSSVKMSAESAMVQVFNMIYNNVIVMDITKIVTVSAVVQLFLMTVKSAVVLVLTGSMVNVIVKVAHSMYAESAVVTVFQMDG